MRILSNAQVAMNEVRTEGGRTVVEMQPVSDAVSFSAGDWLIAVSG